MSIIDQFFKKRDEVLTGEQNGEEKPKVQEAQEGGQDAVQVSSQLDEPQVQEEVTEQSVLIKKTKEGYPYKEYTAEDLPLEMKNVVLARQDVFGRHDIKIVDRTMHPGQLYPWLLDCSCGFQSRVYSEADCIAVGERHIGLRLRLF